MWKIGKLKRGERGFTLIELMIVTAIVGILAAVVSTGVSGTTDNGQIAAKAQDVDLVQQAVDSRYQNVTSDYPYVSGSAPADALITTAVTEAMIEEIDFTTTVSPLVTTYLRELPKHASDNPVTLLAGTTYDLDGDGDTDDPDDWKIAGTIGTATDDIVLTSPWVMDQNGKVYCVIAAKVY